MVGQQREVEAGRYYFGLSKYGGYIAAQRGDFPTIRIGKLLRAPVVTLERMLENAGAGETSQGN